MDEPTPIVSPRVTGIYLMSSLSPELRAKIRNLSLGPVAWGSWTWTFHNGSCWVALLFDGPEDIPEHLIGWVILTKEMDILPVIGCYIREDHRKKGYGKWLITGFVQGLLNANVLSLGDAIFNSSHRWPAYKDILKGLGLRSLTWE